MISIEAKLAESIGEMTEAQKNKFFDARVKGSPVETQVALAAEILKETAPIRRNNGSQSHAEPDALAECDRMIMEAIREKRPQSVKITEQTVGELSESQREDLAFCKLIGMSEADAMKVVKNGGSRS
ncbi:MAG: hypothetical protein WBR21_15350 [Rouxiella badensis]|uniref:hypothetical protein n=1 Tax=Rouxiella badensis TaxID=1646377 RepID=UPI003C537059